MKTSPPTERRDSIDSDPHVLEMRAQAAEWLTVKETADLMKRSIRQIRRYEAEGLMPQRKKAGRRRKYPRAAIIELRNKLANRPGGLKAMSHIGAIGAPSGISEPPVSELES